MKIIIIGNIASGKSTLAKLLSQSLSMNIVCVDDKRNQLFQQGLTSSIKREREAEKLVLEALSNIDCIYESTGVTQLFKRAYNIISKQKECFVVVKLKCSQEQCFLRYNKRKYDGYFQAPFPFKKGRNIKESIRYIHWELKNIDFDIELESNDIRNKDVELIKKYINEKYY